MKKTLIWVAAAFALGLAVSYLATPVILDTYFQQTTFHAMWKDHFNTLGELHGGVDAIAVGQVVAMQPGRIVGDPSNPELEFTNLTFKVDTAIKGGLDREITLEVTGNLLQHQVIFLAQPDFHIGQSYLLFLNRQEDTGYWYVANNQSGYQLILDRPGNVVLHAADPEDKVAAQLHERGLVQALNLIEIAGREAAADHRIR